MEPVNKGRYHLMAGTVTGIAGPGEPLPPERSLGDFAAISNIKDGSPFQEIPDPLRCFMNEDLDEVRVIEIRTSLQRIFIMYLTGVGLPQDRIISPFCHGCAAALSCEGL